MLWFGGPVRSAVDKVKSSGVTLLIFIQGNDELSKAYDSVLECAGETLTSRECVALKISDASVAFKQFKDIYCSVPVPSLFFIKSNGVPAKIFSSSDPKGILNAITEVFQNADSARGNELKKSHKKDQKTELVHCEENRRKGAGYDFIKNDKASLEKDGSKSAYVKNIGYKLFNVSEDEIKKRLSEIRAFPRFLLITTTPVSSSSESPSTRPISKTQSARIQFCLPNNDLPSWEFPDLSTLGDVRAYLMEKANLSPNFKLVRACPRTGFTPQDEHRTLVDLSLTPNATLIVIPVQDKTVQARVKGIVVRQNLVSLVVQTLFRPFLIVISFFKKHVLKIEDERRNERPTRLPSDTGLEKILNKKTSTSNIFGFNFEDDSDN